MKSLTEWAWEGFEADYGAPTCPKCGNDATDGETDRAEDTRDEDKDGETGELTRDDYKTRRGACGDYACDSCRYLFDGDDAFGEEAIGHTLDDGEYAATVDSYNDVFIVKAPYFTRAQFCSPCAPGACHLDNPTDDGERTYCFGHDWFEGGAAPYPVYSVETGELIPAPSK